MITAIALMGYAVTIGTLGVAALRRARWPERAPRLGIMAWQVLSASILGALTFASLSVAVPRGVFSIDFADLLHACVTALQAQYVAPGGRLVHTLAAAVGLALLARAGCLLGTGLVAARRTRARHLADVRLLARASHRLGALIVDHPSALAYCLPGRDSAVVLTSGALATLTEDELRAVLDHERSHLRGHHHLVLAAAEAITRTLPFLPALAAARAEQARLLEMLADDAAARRSTRLTVARALVYLAEGSVPAASLGASNVAALTRVHRLLDPLAPVGLARRTAIVLGLTLTAALPVLIAIAPAIAAARPGLCVLPYAAPPT